VPPLDIDTMDWSALMAYLDDAEHPNGPPPGADADAAEQTAVERRLLALAAQLPVAGDRRRPLRLVCALSVKVRSSELSVRAITRNLGVGGAFVETARRFVAGSPVELELFGPDGHGRALRVRGTVAWATGPGAASPGIGVAFAPDPSGRREREWRRFLLALLRLGHRSSAGAATAVPGAAATPPRSGAGH
jgi:Tfp pilus assembly protein PilZ